MNAARRFAVVAGLGTVATGAWAFFSPASFYDFATYPPYSRHFIHDAGAFMVGLGAVLLFAARFREALFVVFAGNAVGAWFHLASHLADRNLGGGSWRDPILTLVLAIAFTAAALATRKEETT